MDPKKSWLSTVTKLLKNSPLGASLGFGLIQLTLEKLVEAEFSCPCDSSHNFNYSLVVFIVPTIIVFLLMFTVSYSLKLWKNKLFWEALIIIIVPATTWVIIVLVDGRYYACLKTDWSGKYELIENAAPQKWCKPSNSSLERDSLTDTQFWYSKSQRDGFCTALGLTVVYLVCFVCSRYYSSSPEDETTPGNIENAEASELCNLGAVRGEAAETNDMGSAESLGNN